MKIVKQLANKIKSAIEPISTFKPTQLSFWYSGQYVTNETMNAFSKDLYEKLALLATNTNNFPAVIFADGGISKFKVTDDKKFIDLPALSCAFQLQIGQGDNLPYKPYTIAYAPAQRLLISTGTLETPMYIYASVNISNVDTNPTNVPTPIKYTVRTINPLTDPQYCLICVIHDLVQSGTSIDFSQTSFLVNSAVTTTNNTELLNPQNKINAITPQALSLFSNLGHVDAFDERVRVNGGYAKDRVIREYDTTGYWVYYQSLVDNNINPKPTLESHDGWGIIFRYVLGSVIGSYIRANTFEAVEFKNPVRNLVVGQLYPTGIAGVFFRYAGDKSLVIRGRVLVQNGSGYFNLSRSLNLSNDNSWAIVATPNDKTVGLYHIDYNNDYIITITCESTTPTYFSIIFETTFYN